MKAETDKLDIDKLVHVPVDSSKLSDVIKNDVVKKAVYDKLVGKLNSIDISRLVKKANYNAMNIELESKIRSISGLARISAVTAVENRNA